MSASPTGPATLSSVPCPLRADRDERVIHAPHGPEQSDEGRRAADRREHRQTGLEARGFFVDHTPHRPSEEVRRRAGLIQLIPPVLLVMARCDDAVPREVRKRFVGMLLLEARSDAVERGRVPESLQETGGAALQNEALDRLGDDQAPRRHRHEQQRHEQPPADSVGVREKMAEADRLCVHVQSSAPHGGTRPASQRARWQSTSVWRDSRSPTLRLRAEAFRIAMAIPLACWRFYVLAGDLERGLAGWDRRHGAGSRRAMRSESDFHAR